MKNDSLASYTSTGIRELSRKSPLEPSEQRSFKCDTCGLRWTFFFCELVFVHFRFSIESIFVGSSLKTRDRLSRHQTTHSEFEYECVECEKKFRSKYYLRIHMETHTGIMNKPYICDICETGFRHKYLLMVCSNCIIAHKMFRLVKSAPGCIFLPEIEINKLSDFSGKILFSRK